MGSLVKAWAASAVLFIVVSGVWYQVLMKEQYGRWEAAVARPEPQLPFILLGLVLVSLVMAYMYPRGYEGGSPAMEGLRFGALIGLLGPVALTLVVYGAYNLQLAGAVIDAVFNLILFALAGAVIGVIYGESAARSAG